MSRVSLLLHS